MQTQITEGRLPTIAARSYRKDAKCTDYARGLSQSRGSFTLASRYKILRQAHIQLCTCRRTFSCAASRMGRDIIRQLLFSEGNKFWDGLNSNSKLVIETRAMGMRLPLVN